MKFVAVILLQKSADCSETFSPPPAHLVNERVLCELRWADRLLPSLIYEKQCRFERDIQC